ncbi:MAG: exodeoxyribonuclease VII small subunit [Phycisphaerales bacterium]|nr:exodeoxyribonuclease VII small subunit [Planctomycetota bacterium]MBL6997861.1 exodeoxyribonuclease VII small subunit [Phycisphaerales bacterium]
MSTDNSPKPDKMTFEEASEELDAIVKRIEEGDADLEKMMEEHKRGKLLVNRCKELLDKAQQQIQTMESKDLT